MDEPGTDRIRRQVEVMNSLGLTLRAAARFVIVARQYQADILVLDGDKEVSGKSLVDLATLIAPCGTRLDVEA